MATAVDYNLSVGDLEEIYESCKNWGRWGADDQAGALNLLTDDVRAKGAAAVKLGRAISCAHDFPVSPSAETPVPGCHHMISAGDARDSSGSPGYEATQDYVGTNVHGLGITHIDALCHMFVRGEMYNGFLPTDVRSNGGALRNSIMAAVDNLVGRCILIDVPRTRGVDFLEPHQTVTVDDLDASEEAQKVTVEPGDMVIISTGRDARRVAHNGTLSPFFQGLSGLHPECARWLKDRGVSVLGSDGISDHMPAGPVAGWPFPIHQIGITAVGLHLIDNMHLLHLAEACAEAGRWAFQLSVAPLRVVGGTGCPVNPIAVL
jgi:kynurenine formamidase